jgi:ABC-type Fe3+/spermidine/putrescine transport system ATPase subunit
MLELLNLSHAYGSNRVLRNINLQVESGEIFCLLGPSGCGKTTLLRIVAGLEQATAGEIRFQGQSLNHVPVHRREFGFMFQDFALFPHMNVADNVAFGLKMKGAADPATQVQEILHLVGLTGFEKRSVSQLSGGEKQRVALARSLAPRPRLLMLDEPLGSLDAALRNRLVIELHQIIKELHLSTLYVTHDQQEAFAVADRIAIMNAGRIEQVDRPDDLYQRPRTVFAARFLELNNILSLEEFQRLTGSVAVVPASAKAILLHPSGLYCDPQGKIRATIVERVFQGDVYRLRVRLDSGSLLTFNISSHEKTLAEPGDIIRITIAPDRGHSSRR